MIFELSTDFIASNQPEVKVLAEHTMKTSDCFLVNVQSNSLIDTIDLSGASAQSQTTEPNEVNIPQVLEKWTPRLERQFCQLVEKKADGKATLQELEQLEHIKQDRRRLKYSLPIKHIIRNYQRRKALQKILSQINKQVEKIQP